MMDQCKCVRQTREGSVSELEAIVARQSEEIEAATLRVCELKALVAEKEAEVAARAARCAERLHCITERVENLSSLLVDVHDRKLEGHEIEDILHSEIGELADAVAVPDLAASRLLAGDKLAKADGTIEVGKTTSKCDLETRGHPLQITFWGRQFKTSWSSDGSCRLFFAKETDMIGLALAIRDFIGPPREEAPQSP